MIKTSETQFRGALGDAMHIAVIQTLIEFGLIRVNISKMEAQKRYGRKYYHHWVENGKINPQRDEWNNHRFRVNVLECELVRKAYDRAKFIEISTVVNNSYKDIQMSESNLHQLLTELSGSVVKETLLNFGIEKALLSKNRAEYMYGTAQVRKWVLEGLIKSKTDGHFFYFDADELEVLSKSNSRNKFITGRFTLP
jgi:uncharacterized protein (UPF0216 family)